MLWPQVDKTLPNSFIPIGILSFSLSLAVNAIFTGLLVFKIVKSSLALRKMHPRGSQDYTPLITILIESGLVFFLAQVVWIICFTIGGSAIGVTSEPITMIYVCVYWHLPLSFNNSVLKGIIPTTIVVRVTMASSAKVADNQRVTVESALEFAFTDENLPIQNESLVGENQRKQ